MSMCALQMLRSAEKNKKNAKKEIIVEKDLKIITKLLFVVTGGVVNSVVLCVLSHSCLCLLVALSACLLVCLSVCLPVCLFLSLPICLPVDPSACLSLCDMVI